MWLLACRGGPGFLGLHSVLTPLRQLLSPYHVPGTISSLAIHREQDMCPQNGWSGAWETDET